MLDQCSFDFTWDGLGRYLCHRNTQLIRFPAWNCNRKWAPLPGWFFLRRQRWYVSLHWQSSTRWSDWVRTSGWCTGPCSRRKSRRLCSPCRVWNCSNHRHQAWRSSLLSCRQQVRGSSRPHTQWLCPSGSVYSRMNRVRLNFYNFDSKLYCTTTYGWQANKPLRWILLIQTSTFLGRSLAALYFIAALISLPLLIYIQVKAKHSLDRSNV